MINNGEICRVHDDVVTIVFVIIHNQKNAEESGDFIWMSYVYNQHHVVSIPEQERSNPFDCFFKV